MSFFWNARQTAAGRISLNFCIANGESVAQLLAISLTASGQVTELWRHKRYSIWPIFQGNRVFSLVTCCHWQEWGYFAWFRSADDHIWSLKLHFDLFCDLIFVCTGSPKVTHLGWPHTYLYLFFIYLFTYLFIYLLNKQQLPHKKLWIFSSRCDWKWLSLVIVTYRQYRTWYRLTDKI